MNRLLPLARFLCAAFLFLCATSSSATTVHVDASNQGLEDGTPAHPFRTIEPAIAAAAAGDTVWIASGTYTPVDGELVIKPGVTLLGENSTSTIIDGDIYDRDPHGGVAVGVINLTFNEFVFGRGASIGPFVGTNVVKNCVCNAIRTACGATLDTIGYTGHSFTVEDNEVSGNIEFHFGSATGGNGIIRGNQCARILIAHGGAVDTVNYWSFGTTIEYNEVSGMIEFRQGAGSDTEIVRGNQAGGILIYSGALWTYRITDNTLDSGIIDRSGACWTTIADNDVTDGIMFDESGSMEGESEIIEGNSITYSGRKVFVDEIDSEYVVAAVVNRSRSVTFRNNTVSSSISGAYFASGAPTNIVGNTIVVPQAMPPFSTTDSSFFALSSDAGYGVVTGNRLTGGFIGYRSRSGAVLFDGNTIEGAHVGLVSRGGERISNNTITHCSGDGMVLNGVRGPVERNRVTDNGGSGIRVLRADIDLGWGADTSRGENIVQRNGNYDLYVDTGDDTTSTIYARNNYWDHASAEEIAALDIYDKRDVDSLPLVDFSPFGVMSVDEANERDGTVLVLVPNPVIDRGSIIYVITRPGHVRLRIIDLVGREVALLVDEYREGGDHRVSIDAPALLSGSTPAGVYWCELRVDGVRTVRQLIMR